MLCFDQNNQKGHLCLQKDASAFRELRCPVDFHGSKKDRPPVLGRVDFKGTRNPSQKRGEKRAPLGNWAKVLSTPDLITSGLGFRTCSINPI